ncbi:FAD-binding oxidoreductase [Microbulbifer epialgicus]|uniref:FAD-binding oxidoreductase n=1 Tax=Microbulbifer epialgicus TaxID=393907 RepID=A0ABV4P4H7_9GAMM
MKSLLILLLLLSASVEASEIKPFRTDGCSVFPDGTLEKQELWFDCCQAHDYAYWKGGTYTQRELADQELKKCVTQTGTEEVALLMLLGVRVGGTPFLPTPFRWGYGWPYLRGYKALTNEERDAIERAERSN